MKKLKKKLYEVPVMEVLIVKLEQGIAAGSVAAEPQVNDWETGDGYTINSDGL